MDDRQEEALPGGEDPQAALDRLQRSEGRLWATALALLNVLAGGLLLSLYLQGSGGAGSVFVSFTPFVHTRPFLLVCAVLAILFDGYVIYKKRSLARLWRRYLLQGQESVHVAYRLEQLRDVGAVDPLTQVYNRRHFEEIIQREWVRCERDERPLSMLLFDIVNFEAISQSRGALVGDQVLQAVADSLRSTLRQFDILFRYGPNEFMVVLPEIGEEGVARVEERLREWLYADQSIRDVGGRGLELAVARGTCRSSKNLAGVIEEIESQLFTESPGSGPGLAS